MMWTEEDLQKLRAVYPNGDKVEISAAFPLKSWDAIYKMARKQGLGAKSRETANVLWTAEEEEKLRAVFLTTAVQELKDAFPNRTWYSLSQHGRKLGMRRVSRRAWPKPLEDIMNKHFEFSTRKTLMGLIPGRSWGSIVQKGHDMGLTRKAWMSIREPKTPLNPAVSLLRERRIALKLTQKHVAKIAGYGVSAIQRAESGDTKKISFATIQDIAAAMGFKFQLVNLATPDPVAVPEWLKRLIREKMPKSNLISFDDFDRTDVDRIKKMKSWAA